MGIMNKALENAGLATSVDRQYDVSLFRNPIEYARRSAKHTALAFGLITDSGKTELADKLAKLFKAIFENIVFDLTYFGFNPQLIFTAVALQRTFTVLEFWTKSTNIACRLDEWVNQKMASNPSLQVTSRGFLTGGHLLDFSMGFEKLGIVPLATISAHIGRLVFFVLPFAFVQTVIDNTSVRVLKELCIMGASFFAIGYHAGKSRHYKHQMTKWESRGTQFQNVPTETWRTLFTTKRAAATTDFKRAKFTAISQLPRRELNAYKDYKTDKYRSEPLKDHYRQSIDRFVWGNRYDICKILIISAALFSWTKAPTYIIPYSQLLFKEGILLTTGIMRFGLLVNFCGFRKQLVDDVHDKHDNPYIPKPVGYSKVLKGLNTQAA